MKRQNLSLSNGGLDHQPDTAGFDTIAFRNVSQERWMATSVRKGRLTGARPRMRCGWEGERLRGVGQCRRAPAALPRNASGPHV